jgi:hypothetical protein
MKALNHMIIEKPMEGSFFHLDSGDLDSCVSIQLF